MRLRLRLRAGGSGKLIPLTGPGITLALESGSIVQMEDGSLKQLEAANAQ